MGFFNPKPQRIFTAGQLDEDVLEKALRLWESDEGYNIIQDRLNAILERDVFCGDDFWPEGVEVNKDRSGRGWDIDYQLHYMHELEFTATVDLEKLCEEVDAPELQQLKKDLEAWSRADGWDEVNYEVYWDGRQGGWGKFLDIEFESVGWPWLKNYLENLEKQLLEALEEYDTETFNTENFIRIAGLNRWVFDEQGNFVSVPEDDMPQELIDLLDEESEH